jgi:MscS family membrane protein
MSTGATLLPSHAPLADIRSLARLGGHRLNRLKVRPARVCVSGKHRLQFRILRTDIYSLCLVSLLWVPAWTQSSIPGTSPAAAQPHVPVDALGRTTPRGAVLGFVTAARAGDDALAARYLNTRLHGKAATDLAHQLFVVLDRSLPARLNQLSDKPEGSASDPLRPNQDLVGTITGDHNDVDIIVERLDLGRFGAVWLFSGKTLDSIPDLYADINVESADNVLPKFLVNSRFAGIVLFEWLAVFVGMPSFYLLMALVDRLLRHPAGLLRRRLYRKPDLPNPEILPQPIRLLLAAFLIRWLLTKLSLPLLARQFWSSTASIFTVAGCVWVLILLNGRIEEYIHRGLQRRKATGSASVLRLTRRVVDILVIFGGVLVTLRYFGVNPTAELAGFGVGGIAVALAAQKTLENVIGGLSLIFDKALKVGDFLRVGETLGTVDDISLRSTQIRTLDRTMVSVPNGQLANMTLENFSSRDKFWLHPILALGYGTASAQLYAVLDGIRGLLQGSRHVEPESVRVRFLRFGLSSLDVEVFAYVLARDWSEFLEIQEAILVGIMECIESAGVQIALPSQTIFMVPASRVSEGGIEGGFKTSSPEGDLSKAKITAKSAYSERSSR